MHILADLSTGVNRNITVNCKSATEPLIKTILSSRDSSFFTILKKLQATTFLTIVGVVG
jgi:hypothetical protein